LAEGVRVPGFSRWAFLLPIAGTIGFFAVALPGNVHHIVHLHHYYGRTAWESFDPAVGLQYTAQSLIDNLVLGTLGISGVAMPKAIVVVGLCGLIAAAVWWWLRATCRALLVLGLGFILLSDILIYSGRAAWIGQGMHHWTRYNVFPHAGLTLFICGGLSPLHSTSPARRQTKTLLGVMTVLFLVNLPRGIIQGLQTYDPEQMPVLRRIDNMDARCRAHHISASTAREVLPILHVPHCGDDSNGWKLLRGSPEPRSIAPEEARRLLSAPE
jgi:hypothetical protein